MNTEDLFQRLNYLNTIGAALSSERDINRLLENILTAAKTITHADGGTLYRVVNESQLNLEIVLTDSLNIAMGGTTGVPIPYKPIPLQNKKGEPNNSMVAAYVALHRETVNIEDAYTIKGFDFSGTKQFDSRTGYRSQSFLTVPMQNHENEVIGVLQLINAKDPQTGKITVFSDADQKLAESLASQAAIALTNRQLITQLEQLFECFIGIINAAIDEKSPYTGAHCQRVPLLTMMLAEAVHETDTGPLKDFKMTERDRYELHIAGLLHDCGKITTPVHVVDKATKLETLFDRIHLVDARFEVVKRDLLIALMENKLNQKNATKEDQKALEVDYQNKLKQLEEDRNFLRHCNIGGEAMSPEHQERIKQIARLYQWRNEENQYVDFLSEDEIKNLIIPRGTLNKEERDIINYHIVTTIRMLEALPWPKYLKNVPEYAGGHHERMDGKGYPRGLKREQMSIQARIMGIADIFEALTARDRPYKVGMMLSEALSILGKFKLNGHIDPDLFDIFIEKKIYEKYAEMFLQPEQIDKVDLNKIPGYTVCGEKVS